ncbi:MAG: UBP-type zinc finger domain-containing protein [Ornithinimicrobium sp.]|jgi:uncharacterized UBP type Zn finger protein|uniref:UBP-type zinc finger domain-containing protein n=1 Tax=Ornithinimicrobium sp. TaxID=1977084 RepID=UPI003D9B58B7
MAQSCTHRDTIDESSMPSSTYGCSDCLATGGRWVHLRMCSSCGRVGCCNSSPGKHATAHHDKTSHPLIRSYEPREDWYSCYPDGLTFELPDVPPALSHS